MPSVRRLVAAHPHMEFDVFGRRIIVERRGDAWASFEPGDDGKRSASRFVIPPDLPEEGLARYLADLFHECARPDQPDVNRIR
jgi:hypothetical protein